MSKFKIGTKVKIPKSKSPKGYGNYDQFLEELRQLNYSKDYLVIINTYDFTSEGVGVIYHAKPEGILSFNRSAFLESDLELYEEPNQVSFKEGDKVRFLGKEACDKSHYQDVRRYVERDNLIKGEVYIVTEPTNYPSGNYVDLEGKEWTHPVDIFELVKEEQVKTMNKKFKNQLSIHGNRYLLEAFAKELDDIGYIANSISGYYDWNSKITNIICGHGDNGTDYGYHNHDSSVQPQHILTLPKDWERALELAKEIDTPKLEVGKWYKLIGEKCIAKYAGNNSGVGIDKFGNWGNGIHMPENSTKFILATSEEIKQELVVEAKKRGFKTGVKFNCARTTRTNAIQGSEDWEYSLEADCLSSHMSQFFYSNGKWAEITVDKTPKITVNGYTAKFHDTYVEFGCAKFSVTTFKCVLDLANHMEFSYQTNRTLDTIKLGKGEFTIEQVKQIVDYYNQK